MSVAARLRIHKKKVVIHTSIVVGFVLFTVFLAEPLFDRLDRIPGEARLYQVSLPAETYGIVYAFDSLVTDDPRVVEMTGWAFMEGHDTDRTETYIVLRSPGRTYVFGTAVRVRPDVTKAFEELDLDLDESGFMTVLPTRKIAGGEYALGLYIRKGDIEALTYTDMLVVRTMEGTGLRLSARMSGLQEMLLPGESHDLRAGIDACRGAVANRREFLEISGWAYIDGQSAENSKIYVVLRSERATYVFDTVPQRRPDVTAHFADLGLDLDESGFIARIPAESTEAGTYALGIYVRKGDSDALQYLDKAVVMWEGSVSLTVRTSVLQEIALPAESGNITCRIDRLEETETERGKLIEVDGWAFIDGQSAEDSETYVVLKSDTDTYVFDTIMQERPDVTDHFDELGLDLDSSGFVARIPKEIIERGPYRLGIYIRKGDIEGLRYIDRTVEF